MSARQGRRGKAKTAIERVFSPEFRNRLDAIVTFRALSPDAMETIVEKFIMQLEAQLTERKVAIALTPAARAWLAAKGYDRVFGARPLARVIQREVRDLLTDQILFGALEHGGTVTIDAADDRLSPSRTRARRARGDDEDVAAALRSAAMISRRRPWASRPVDCVAVCRSSVVLRAMGGIPNAGAHRAPVGFQAARDARRRAAAASVYFERARPVARRAASTCVPHGRGVMFLIAAALDRFAQQHRASPRTPPAHRSQAMLESHRSLQTA